MSKYTRLNTTIIPDRDTQAQAFSLIEKLRQHAEPEFFVSRTGPFPHITLYAPEYPEPRIHEVESTLDDFCRNTNSFSVPFSHIEVVDDGGVFFVYEKITEVDDFRNNVITTLNSLREGHIRQEYKNQLRFNEEQKRDVEKYGYPLTSYTFPHITLCKFSNREEAEAAVAAVAQDFDIPDISVESIGLFTMGTLGRCVGLVREYNLLSE